GQRQRTPVAVVESCSAPPALQPRLPLLGLAPALRLQQRLRDLLRLFAIHAAPQNVAGVLALTITSSTSPTLRKRCGLRLSQSEASPGPSARTWRPTVPSTGRAARAPPSSPAGTVIASPVSLPGGITSRRMHIGRCGRCWPTR